MGRHEHDRDGDAQILSTQGGDPSAFLNRWTRSTQPVAQQPSCGVQVGAGECESPHHSWTVAIIVSGELEDHITQPEEVLLPFDPVDAESALPAQFDPGLGQGSGGAADRRTDHYDVVDSGDMVRVRFGRWRFDGRRGEGKAVDATLHTVDSDSVDSSIVAPGEMNGGFTDTNRLVGHREPGRGPWFRRVADHDSVELMRRSGHGVPSIKWREPAAASVVSPPVDHAESFADLFMMADQGPDCWVARSAAYPWGRVYGGQVAAQGLWAAAATVDPRYVPHSLHAYFIRSGEISEPIRFEVDRIRDGGSFATRRVVARQSGGAILNLSASFHIVEDAPDVTVIEMPTGLTSPEELPRDDWGPLVERCQVSDDRARSWLRVPGEESEDPLWHAIAHTFTSDDLPTEAVEFAHPLGRDTIDDYDARKYMGASLDHTIWFHRLAPADDWVLHDFTAKGVYGARGMASGELWSRDGIHIATVNQEVLLRVRDQRG